MKEYGGYIEFENYHGSMLHDGTISLNCGRNALAYLCEAKKIKKLYLPHFLCSSVPDLCDKMGLAFCAEPIVRLVLTDKWLPCVPFLRIFCITYMFYPIHTTNLNAIKAMGRSDLFLRLEIAKKIVGMILLLSTMWFGVMAMAYSLLVSSVLSQIINSWPNRKLLNYGYLEQLKDILPGIILAVFMGFCVNLVSLLDLSNIVTLLIQIPLGAVIYIVSSALLHLESFKYLIDMIRPMTRKIIRK